MQAMAPGLRSEPQAGHFAAEPLAADGAGVGGSPDVGPDGLLVVEGCGGGAGAGPEGGSLETTALTGWGAGIGKTVWHLGQRTCLPAEPSGTCSAIEHFGQLITCGMVVLGCRRSASPLSLFLSLTETQQATADADGVAILQWRRPLDAGVVDERPARRVGVLQDVPAILHHNASMHFLDALFPKKTKVATLGAANRRLVLVQHHLSTGTAAHLDGNPGFL